MVANLPDAPRSIAIFRALQLGDMLCAIPALRALRRRWPDARIVLIGLPWQRDLIARFPGYVDELLVFPGYPGLPEQGYNTRQLIAFLQEMNNRAFDVLLQMHGNGSAINPLIALSGAKWTAGFRTPGGYCPDVGTFIDYPEERHEIERLLSLVRHLGIEAEPALEFPVTENDRLEFYRLASRQRLHVGSFACLHPGARDPARRWDIEHFTTVAQHLLARGMTVVITGTQAEKEIGNRIVGALEGRVIDLVGRTSLGVLAALIENARLLVCNDTGVSHIAAARKTPSVVIFSASDPARWAPLDHALHFAVPPNLNHDVENVLRLIDAALVAHPGKQAL